MAGAPRAVLGTTRESRATGVSKDETTLHPLPLESERSIRASRARADCRLEHGLMSDALANGAGAAPRGERSRRRISDAARLSMAASIVSPRSARHPSRGSPGLCHGTARNAPRHLSRVVPEMPPGEGDSMSGVGPGSLRITIRRRVVQSPRSARSGVAHASWAMTGVAAMNARHLPSSRVRRSR